MSRADWISVNRKEASVLTGTNDPALAVQKLAAGRQGAIVRSGEDGCRLSLSGMPMQHVTGFGVDTIDTNGAGDTHDGAFIAACGRGFDPLDAAMFANAAAALSTTRQGPATAPDFQETQAFLEAQGMCLSPPGHGSSEKARLGVTGR